MDKEQIKKDWNTPKGEMLLRAYEKLYGKYKKITYTATGKTQSSNKGHINSWYKRHGFA